MNKSPAIVTHTMPHTMPATGWMANSKHVSANSPRQASNPFIRGAYYGN